MRYPMGKKLPREAQPGCVGLPMAARDLSRGKMMFDYPAPAIPPNMKDGKA
jgi:hypothetical protein